MEGGEVGEEVWLGVLVGEFELVEGGGVFEGVGGEVFVAGYVEAGWWVGWVGVSGGGAGWGRRVRPRGA